MTDLDEALPDRWRPEDGPVPGRITRHQSAAGLDAEPAPGFPASRYVLRTADQQTAWEVWLELCDWVEWLRIDYTLQNEIPPCWPRHTGLRNELLALMAAWKAAYASRTDPNADEGAKPTVPEQYWIEMANWHQYLLRPFVAALSTTTYLKAASEDCRRGTCVMEYTPIKLWPGAAAFMSADVEQRERATERRPRAAAVPSERALSSKAMRKLVVSGDAAQLDPADPQSRISYDGAVWCWDRARSCYVAQIDTSTGESAASSDAEDNAGP